MDRTRFYGIPNSNASNKLLGVIFNLRIHYWIN
jgi:hypothetical protein